MAGKEPATAAHPESLLPLPPAAADADERTDPPGRSSRRTIRLLPASKQHGTTLCTACAILSTRVTSGLVAKSLAGGTFASLGVRTTVSSPTHLMLKGTRRSGADPRGAGEGAEVNRFRKASSSTPNTPSRRRALKGEGGVAVPLLIEVSRRPLAPDEVELLLSPDSMSLFALSQTSLGGVRGTLASCVLLICTLLFGSESRLSVARPYAVASSCVNMR